MSWMTESKEPKDLLGINGIGWTRRLKNVGQYAMIHTTGETHVSTFKYPITLAIFVDLEKTIGNLKGLTARGHT